MKNEKGNLIRADLLKDFEILEVHGSVMIARKVVGRGVNEKEETNEN